MEIQNKDIKKLIILGGLCFLLVGLCIGVVIGEYYANYLWIDFYKDYKLEMAKHCSYDPENPQDQSIPELFLP